MSCGTYQQIYGADKIKALLPKLQIKPYMGWRNLALAIRHHMIKFEYEIVQCPRLTLCEKKLELNNRAWLDAVINGNDGQMIMDWSCYSENDYLMSLFGVNRDDLWLCFKSPCCTCGAVAHYAHDGNKYCRRDYRLMMGLDPDNPVD